MTRLITAPQRARDLATVVLAVVSGATDAIGFVALGGAFTSVMTGNMVLIGIAGGRGDGSLAGHASAALAGFVAGCALGARLAGTAAPGQAVWPRRLNIALSVEAAVFLVNAALWWSQGSTPHGSLQIALLSSNALALGVQSSGIQRFGVAGLSTTYMTGTLTTMVLRLANGGGLRDALPSARLLVGLVGGAAAGALLATKAPGLAPALAPVALGLVGLLYLRATRHGAPVATVTQTPQAAGSSA